MKAKKILAALLAAGMVLSLAACGGGNKSENNAPAEKPADNAAQGSDAAPVGEKDAEQVINTYMSSEPTTLDPSRRSDSYSSDILMNTMDGLVRLEQRDGEYKFMPGDAETWESNEDSTVWTFHIGADRKWSDGEPVTAEQYVYSLQRSADPNTGCPNSFFVEPILNYGAISRGEMAPEELGVKAIDSQTLEITLTTPMASFLESTDNTIYYPQRKEIVEANGDQYGADADKMVYNGPFVVEEWVHNSSIKLVKNENYWDKDEVDLQTINMQIMSDSSALANAYDAGTIDFIGASSQEDIMKYSADPNSVFTETVTGDIVFLFFNTNDTLFGNEKMRKAFSMAVDQEELNDFALDGMRNPLYGWVAEAISVGETSMRAVAGDTLKDMREEFLAASTPKDLLIEAMGELGLGSDPSTLDVTLSLAGTDQWFHTFGEYFQQLFKEELGVNLKISFNEWGIFSDNCENGNYQMAYMAWGPYYNDPYDMLSVNLSDFQQIYTGWADAQYDEIMAAAKAEKDADKRMQDYIDAEKIFLESYSTCPLASSVSHSFSKSYVHDKYAEYGQDRLCFRHTGFKYVYTSGR